MSWIDLIEFIKQWGRLFMLSFLAAGIQMYLSKRQFTFFHYFMSVLIAIFAYSHDFDHRFSSALIA